MLAGRAVCIESALIDHALDCGRGDSKDGGGLTHAVRLNLSAIFADIFHGF